MRLNMHVIILNRRGTIYMNLKIMIAAEEDKRCRRLVFL